MDSMLIIASKRKQLKCPQTEEWINCNKWIKCSTAAMQNELTTNYTHWQGQIHKHYLEQNKPEKKEYK